MCVNPIQAVVICVSSDVGRNGDRLSAVHDGEMTVLVVGRDLSTEIAADSINCLTGDICQRSCCCAGANPISVYCHSSENNCHHGDDRRTHPEGILYRF